MAQGSFLDPMITELDAFEARVRDLAQDIVAQIFAAELARREAAGELDLDDDDDEDDDRDGADDAGHPHGERGARADAAEAEAAEAAEAAAAEAGTVSPTRTADAPPARGAWTRDTVITQLATWLLGGNPVEASYLIRHRQRALVTNAKKFFGRFEAALNAANLHLAREYPDGIPSKKASKLG